ncbi:KN57gp_107 [Dikerogammarus haemobaphes nudivirus]|nr:KN57gp_107 [Dikerogammarus haemobaphes nudivirus]
MNNQYQLQNQKLLLNFEKIKRRVTNVENADILEKIFHINSILFDETFINSIITLASLNEYTLNNFSDIFNLYDKSSLFYDFTKAEDDATLKGYDVLFNIYFEAISLGGTLSPNVIKTKIFTLLKLKITIPSFTTNFNIKNISASVSSGYKPIAATKSVAACDIKNIIKSTFYNAVENAQIEKFEYNSWSNNLALPGPILGILLSNIVLYQDLLLSTAVSCGAETIPFIVNNSSSKLLYE